MKKVFFLAPVAALALAACSSEDALQQQTAQTAQADNQLVIRPIVQGNTRGEMATSQNLTEFSVKIYGAFNTTNATEGAEAWSLPTTKTLTGSGSTWAFPDGVAFWWANNTTPAEFKAWAPASLTETNNIIADYTVIGDVNDADNNTIADQEDIIVAFNSGLRDNLKSGVPLNFQHVLSQIAIKAVNTSLSDVKIEVAGVKVVGVANKNSLTLPATSTASGTFSWADYTPWVDDATGSATYASGATAANAAGAALTDQASSIVAAEDGALLLMPQTLPNKTDLTGSYLAVLVRISETAEVPLKNYEGKYLKTDGSAIAFDSKSEGASTENTYDNQKLDVTNKTYNDEAIQFGPKVIYPREGRGNNSKLFAWIAVPITTTWQPGYKYTYTLNFAKDAYGIAAQTQNNTLTYGGEEEASRIGEAATNDAETVHFPYGVDDIANVNGGSTPDDPVKPDEPVVDNPVQLTFATVTVDSWTDAAETPNMK